MTKRECKILRDLKYKKHLKHLHDIHQNYWFPPTYKKDNLYYKRLYISDWKGTKAYKKYANTKVRQYKGDLPHKGNMYKKIFDLKWELY